MRKKRGSHVINEEKEMIIGFKVDYGNGKKEAVKQSRKRELN